VKVSLGLVPPSGGVEWGAMGVAQGNGLVKH